MDDLISRQAAIRWVKTECNPYGKPTLDFESGKKVIEHLEQMPSADRPRGEWVYHKDNMPCVRWDRWECDQCHNRTEYVSDYCPNCGADMKGGNDAAD